MLWLAIAVGLVTIGVGVVVFFSNRRNRANQVFFAYALLIGAWVIVNGVSLYVADDQLLLLSIRLVMFITAPLFAVLFLLAKTYPNGSLSLEPWQKAVLTTLPTAAMLAALTPWMFASVAHVGSDIVPQPGPLIALYALNVVFFIPLSIVVFVKRWRKTSGLGQLQLKYVLVSLIAALLTVLTTNFLLVVVFGNAHLLEGGTLLAALFMAIIPSYPVLQQRLFGVEFIAGRTLYYATLIVTMYLGLLLFLRAQDRQWFGPERTQLIILVAAVVLIVVFLWLSGKIKNLVDTYIVYHGRNFTKLKSDYLRAVSRESSLDVIVNQLFDVIAQTLGVRKQMILLVVTEDRSERFILGRQIRASFTDEDMRLGRGFWNDLTWSHQPLVAQEDISNKLPVEKRELYLGIKGLMEKHRVEIVFPIFINDNYQGVFLFGGKENNTAFYAQDISYLQGLMDATMPVLGRSTLYTQINKFNELLQKRVNEKSRDLSKAYKELELAYVKLQRLDQAKDDFVSVASHELRTPMTAIRNSIFMAQRETEVKPNTKLARFLEITYGSTERLIKLVNDMLTISRIEAGKTDFVMERFNLLDLIERVHREVESIAKTKKIYFKVDAKTKQWFIEGDQDKLHVAVMNLVSNALKFTTKGGVTIKLRREKQMVFLTVSDTGAGIRKEDLGKLFEKFTKLESSYVKVAENGTGLGLNIAQQIAGAHHGRITVSSVLGKGTAFTLQLPAAR